MTTLFEAFEQASKRFVEAAWSSSTHWHIVDLTQPAKNNFGWAIVASFDDRDERNRALSRRILETILSDIARAEKNNQSTAVLYQELRRATNASLAEEVRRLKA